MLPDSFVFSIAEYLLRAAVPGLDDVVAIENDECVVFYIFNKQRYRSPLAMQLSSSEAIRECVALKRCSLLLL